MEDKPARIVDAAIIASLGHRFGLNGFSEDDLRLIKRFENEMRAAQKKPPEVLKKCLQNIRASCAILLFRPPVSAAPASVAPLSQPAKAFTQ